MKIILASLLFVLWVTPTHADQASIKAGICQALFNGEPLSAEFLPDQIPMPRSRVDISLLFSTALHSFQENFSEPNVRAFAEKILKGGYLRFSNKEFKNIKQNRMYAQVLRSSYILFGSTHTPPILFEEFVRILGKMIDRTDDGSEEKAKKHAERVLELLNMNIFNLATPVVAMSTVGSFQNYVRYIRNTILLTLNAPDINVQQYHDLRKLVRHFKNLVDLINIENSSQESQNLRSFLKNLNKLMGESVDDLKDDENDLGTQGQLRVTIDPDYKKAIQDFLTRILIF